MTRGGRWRSATTRQLSGNVMARGAAMVVLALATLLVARTAGPAGVGHYALLRVLTGLAGVAAAAGLPSACAYFLAGASRSKSSLATTLTVFAIISGSAGMLAWALAAPLLTRLFFAGLPVVVVALAGTTVLSQLLVTVGRSCMQGRGDIHGSNVVFVLEEIGFLPAYVILTTTGVVSTSASIVLALLAADVVGAGYAWLRLVRRGFFHHASTPSLTLARQVASYGMRAQLGGILALLNLRLDFVLLGALAGPEIVGIYAVASKYAEMLRVPSLALTYVLYPRFAREGAYAAVATVRRLVTGAAGLSLIGAAALAVLAPLVLPFMYGTEFAAALLPALVLLAGLLGDGIAALLTAYLYGAGRPGLNSWATAAGLLVTVVLDIWLIPRYGAVGAAAASSVAYVSVTVLLVVAFRSAAAAALRRDAAASGVAEVVLDDDPPTTVRSLR